MMLVPPHLLYTTRPSSPFSCVGAKKPLIFEEFEPVAPLRSTRAARALSSATDREATDVYSAA